MKRYPTFACVGLVIGIFVVSLSSLVAAEQDLQAINTTKSLPLDHVARAKTEAADPSMAVTDGDRQFWSFQPLRSVAVPEVEDEPWCRTPIDRFILAKQEAAGLRPNPPADPRTLVRRATFDLLGLPATPAEVEAYVATADPDAWPQFIEQRLQSKHFGERWAQHWMDIARFAESHGYEQDDDRPHAYHYRDFLIQAFNRDMPFDQFVRWQLAGDELAPGDPLAMMATGFLGAGPFPTQLTEAEFESARYDELDDMVTTTGVAFLGLSVGCARCHDHKFDPIPSSDYYRMAATFTTAIRSEIDLDLGPPENEQTLPEGQPLDAALTQKRDQGPELTLTKVMVTSEGLPHLKHHADDRGYPHFYPQTYVLNRGDVHQKQQVAAAGFLQVLTPTGLDETYWQVSPPNEQPGTSFRRASLAKWMTDADAGAGSLVARVIVNRLWQHHFGRGLVATPNDFGVSGDSPSHPELLEWLARDLVEHNWQLKRLHRLIMTSSVYLQSARHDEARATVDRENTLLWHWTPRRLEAEAIRDSLLAVAGKLDRTMYGPGTLDPNMTRRSIYFFIKRSQLIPMLMLFDWPEHLVSIGQRSSTTIAPQALLFLNSDLSRECAQSLASPLRDRSATEAVSAAYRLVFSRLPTDQESRLALAFLKQQQALYEQRSGSEPQTTALIDLCQSLVCMNEFIYIE